MNERGWTTKKRTTRKGREMPGRPWGKTELFKLLTNVVYVGKVRYKDEVHPGLHTGIVEPELWQRVQAVLAVRAMQYSSLTGENVLDLFGGSGSTLIAAEQTGRNAFLMELDMPYCDVIVERWEKFTGKKAVRISGDATTETTPTVTGAGSAAEVA
jgi:hypothetical protein